jgi:hypothetical protein
MKLGINFECIFLHISRFSYFRTHIMGGLNMSRHEHSLNILFVVVLFLTLNPVVSAQPVGSLDGEKAYPNPFREQLTIEYQLQQDGQVEIQINNILGQKIKSFIKEDQQTGLHRVKWDGMDESGSIVANGMYYITLRTKMDKKVIKILKTK